MIKAVLFDVDGVLLDSFDANLKFYQDLFVKMGYKPPTVHEFKELIHYTLEKVIKEFTKASDQEVQRMLEIGKKSIEELYPYELLKTPPYVEETIEKLNKIYQLGIVTSRVKHHIYAVASLACLQKYMQVTVGFEDTKKHKPDPQPLLFASKKLGLQPQEVLYVGDALSDILAGKAAGMKVIHFGKEHFDNADAKTNSFKALLGIISTM